MPSWVSELKKASENRRQKKEAGEVGVAPGVTVGSLRCFRDALTGPTQRR